MRCALLLIAAAAGSARADDGAAIGAAVGAGAQGDATYGAVELRLDAEWHGAKLGLAARGVWLDGVFRRSDWRRAADVVTVVRELELGDSGLGLVAGGLSPAYLAHVSDGYRNTLDDRLRTGVRGVLATSLITADAEIDDVLDPTLVGGVLAVRVAPVWTVHAATAIDPGVTSATELGFARSWRGGAPEADARHAKLDVGGALVGEPSYGLAAVGFAAGAIERGATRLTVAADVRAGTGTLGAAFGPLYRIERGELQSRSGAGAGITAGLASSSGWFTAGVRARPGLGTLGVVSAGAPMGRTLQAGAWLAATRHAAAGAAEARVVWTRRWFSALRLARMYEATQTMPMTPAIDRPSWSLTAWFGATSD